MDVDQIRLKNLEALLSDYKAQREREGTKFLYKDFARDHGMSEKNLQHIRTGVRNMGKNIARRIEHARGLQVGWMDQDHSLGDMDDQKKAFIEFVSKVWDENRSRAMGIAQQIMKNNKKK